MDEMFASIPHQQLVEDSAAPSPALMQMGASVIAASVRVEPDRPDIAIEAAMQQLCNNVTLLKYRLLSVLEAPLTELEQQSLIVGTEQDPERKRIAQDELALLHDIIAAKTSTQFKRARSQSISSMKMSGGISNVAPCASVNSLGNLGDILKEHVDNTFRFAYEELSLRIASNRHAIEERLGPQKLLNKAIERQRDLVERTLAENEQLKKECDFLKSHARDSEGSLRRKDELHKQRLNAFLREIALVKEQLYRAHRDGEYAPVNIDLMPPLSVSDEDERADINIDTLLQYRRTVKEVELEVGKLRQQLKLKEDELMDKEQLIGMIQEKARAREVMAAKAKSEIEQLNNLSIELQSKNLELTNEVTDLALEVDRLKASKPATADFSDMATIDQDEADAVVLYNSELSSVKAESKSFVLTELDNQTTGMKKALADAAETKATLERERAEASNKRRELEQRADYAERMMAEYQAAAAAAKAKQEDAEARAADFANTSALQATALARELSKAQNAVVILRSQNAALCQAFANVSERLTMLKTRAGLVNYKKRSNEHHIKRAQQAIEAAKERIQQVEAACRDQVDAAKRETSIAQHRLTFAQEDALLAERQHEAQLNELIRRIQQVERVSAALLEDYDRLRVEHLKANVSRMEQLVNAPADMTVAGGRVSSASRRARLAQRQGSADRSSRQGSAERKAVAGAARPSSGSTRKEVFALDLDDPTSLITDNDRQSLAVIKSAGTLSRLAAISQSRLADAPRELTAQLIVKELRRHSSVLLLRLHEILSQCLSLDRESLERPEEAHFATWDALHLLVGLDADVRSTSSHFFDTLTATKLIPPEEVVPTPSLPDIPAVTHQRNHVPEVSAPGAAAPAVGSPPPTRSRPQQQQQSDELLSAQPPPSSAKSSHLFDAFATVSDDQVLPVAQQPARRATSGGSPIRRTAKWAAAQRAFPAPLAPLPAPTGAVSQYPVLPETDNSKLNATLPARTVLDVEQPGPFGDHAAVDRQYAKLKARLESPQVESTVPRWKQFKEQRRQL